MNYSTAPTIENNDSLRSYSFYFLFFFQIWLHYLERCFVSREYNLLLHWFICITRTTASQRTYVSAMFLFLAAKRTHWRGSKRARSMYAMQTIHLASRGSYPFLLFCCGSLDHSFFSYHDVLLLSYRVSKSCANLSEPFVKIVLEKGHIA